MVPDIIGIQCRVKKCSWHLSIEPVELSQEEIVKCYELFFLHLQKKHKMKDNVLPGVTKAGFIIELTDYAVMEFNFGN